MKQLIYAKAERLWLKNHAQFTEAWLQDRIFEDPAILGLGDLVAIERERRQEKAGRLDLLLANLENNVRYEVELMLGATDESHIIRTIEYWDIERRRYPGYDHCAVLVAEDITSRFLNLLGLFSGTIPLIAIQLSALDIDGKIVLNFVRVIDRSALRVDDEVEAKIAQVDREYWVKYSGPKIIEIADQVVAFLNEKAEFQHRLNYNRSYIGLNDGTRSRNFIYFRPGKQFLHLIAALSAPEEWLERLSAAGVTVSQQPQGAKVTLTPKEMSTHQELIRELVHQAYEDYQK